MYSINPLLDKRVNSKHIEIADILWDEPNDIYSIEDCIHKTAMTDSVKNLSISALDNILFDLVLLNWVVIKHDMYCLTPFGRKILENISDRRITN
jgi:predicted transcriptional regulator